MDVAKLLVKLGLEIEFLVVGASQYDKIHQIPFVIELGTMRDYCTPTC